jgi:hypothetical protein
MLLVEKHVTVRFSESRLRTRNEALSILLELSNFLASAIELEPLLCRAHLPVGSGGTMPGLGGTPRA